MFKQFLMSALAVAVITSCSCKDPNKPGNRNKEVADAGVMPAVEEKVTRAVALIKPVKGNKINGKVTFTKVPGGIKVVADIEGLKPGKHGFHIHEFGDCGGEDASAAGAHFNPTQQEHGGPDSEIRHVGDLGNIIADENGQAHYERIDKVIRMDGKDSILGRSIIIHADPDDYKTQPAGASGARIACGVIEPAVSSSF